MDVGTVSSEDVLESYQRQLLEAHQRIAMLEAAIARDRKAGVGPRPMQPVMEGPADGGEVA